MSSLYGIHHDSYNGTCFRSFVMNMDTIAVVVASIIAAMLLVSIIKDNNNK